MPFHVYSFTAYWTENTRTSGFGPDKVQNQSQHIFHTNHLMHVYKKIGRYSFQQKVIYSMLDQVKEGILLKNIIGQRFLHSSIKHTQTIGVRCTLVTLTALNLWCVDFHLSQAICMPDQELESPALCKVPAHQWNWWGLLNMNKIVLTLWFITNIIYYWIYMIFPPWVMWRRNTYWSFYLWIWSSPLLVQRSVPGS